MPSSTESVSVQQLGIGALTSLTDSESLCHAGQIPDLQVVGSEQICTHPRKEVELLGTHRLHGELRDCELALVVDADLAIGYTVYMSTQASTKGGKKHHGAYSRPLRTLSSSSES